MNDQISSISYDVEAKHLLERFRDLEKWFKVISKRETSRLI